jgi:hypothetical protein
MAGEPTLDDVNALLARFQLGNKEQFTFREEQTIIMALEAMVLTCELIGGDDEHY